MEKSIQDAIKQIQAVILPVLIAFFALFGVRLPALTGTWQLANVPEPRTGIYSETVFNTGCGLDLARGAADKSAPDRQNSCMQLSTDIKAGEFSRYLQNLAQDGWRKTFENTIENNHYYAFEKDGRTIYFYTNNADELRVIDDCCNTVSLDAFGYTSDAEKAFEPAVYQFSYPYRDKNHSSEKLYATNGMFYVIRLSDGKLILIDGGAKKQATDQNIEECWRFLHEITGREADEPIDVAMWYCTHCHSDHTNFFLKLLNRHGDSIRLERALFNFQSNSVISMETSVQPICKAITQRYPALKYVKARSGYKFRLQDAACQILYTHEDFVSAKDASWKADNPNDAGVVMQMEIGGKRFLFLGDSNKIVQTALMNNFSESTLHADVLQAAHHLFNDLTALYPVVSPQYVFCPQSKLRAEGTPMAAYKTLRKVVPADRFFFANRNIVYGLVPLSGGDFRLEEIPVKCVKYDNSALQ